jgi:hypothetical protein
MSFTAANRQVRNRALASIYDLLSPPKVELNVRDTKETSSMIMEKSSLSMSKAWDFPI